MAFALLLLVVSLGMVGSPEWLGSLARALGAGAGATGNGTPRDGTLVGRGDRPGSLPSPEGALEWPVFVGEPDEPSATPEAAAPEGSRVVRISPLDPPTTRPPSMSGAPARSSSGRRHGPPGTPVAPGPGSKGGSAQDEQQRIAARSAALAKPGFAAPGRAQPQEPAPIGTTAFNWTYRSGGTEYECSTTIAVAPGDGLRREAVVTTSDTHSNVLVTYGGTAFIDSDGITQVDSRNRPVSGPWADRWSPDSFAIDEYGSVHSMDDFRRTGDGWVTTR